MIKKVTLKTLKNVYGRGRDDGKELVFNRSAFKDSITTHFSSDGYRETLKVGDELVISYKSGGAFRGWFISTGNSADSYVALCWFPFYDSFELVHITSKPIPCNWSHLVSLPSVLQAKTQVEELKNFDGDHFTFELQL